MQATHSKRDPSLASPVAKTIPLSVRGREARAPRISVLCCRTGEHCCKLSRLAMAGLPRCSSPRTLLQQIQINLFQALCLRGPIEIVSDCFPAVAGDAQKKIGTLGCLEQRSR